MPGAYVFKLWLDANSYEWERAFYGKPIILNFPSLNTSSNEIVEIVNVGYSNGIGGWSYPISTDIVLTNVMDNVWMGQGPIWCGPWTQDKNRSVSLRLGTLIDEPTEVFSSDLGADVYGLTGATTPNINNNYRVALPFITVKMTSMINVWDDLRYWKIQLSYSWRSQDGTIQESQDLAFLDTPFLLTSPSSSWSSYAVGTGPTGMFYYSLWEYELGLSYSDTYYMQRWHGGPFNSPTNTIDIRIARLSAKWVTWTELGLTTP